jgi:hypothetical protein
LPPFVWKESFDPAERQVNNIPFETLTAKNISNFDIIARYLKEM